MHVTSKWGNKSLSSVVAMRSMLLGVLERQWWNDHGTLSPILSLSHTHACMRVRAQAWWILWHVELILIQGRKCTTLFRLASWRC